MIAFYRALSELRRALPVLRLGSVKPLCAGHGYIAYARFDAADALAVVLNNTDRPMEIDLPLRDVGIPDGAEMVARFTSTADGFSAEPATAGVVLEGVTRYCAPAYSAGVLVRQ